MKDQFTGNDVAVLFQLPRSNIQQYIKRGLIIPSIKKADGFGSKNYFSLSDLYKIKLFITLHTLGLSQPIASDLAFESDFEKFGEDDDNYVRFSYMPENYKLSVDHFDSDDFSISNNSEINFIINLKKIRDEVDGIINRIEKIGRQLIYVCGRCGHPSKVEKSGNCTSCGKRLRLLRKA